MSESQFFSSIWFFLVYDRVVSVEPNLDLVSFITNKIIALLDLRLTITTTETTHSAKYKVDEKVK